MICHSRRRLLRQALIVGGAALAPSLAVQASQQQPKIVFVQRKVQKPRAAGVDFYNTNTGETSHCPLSIDGADTDAVQRRLNYIFRDWRTNGQFNIDLGLLDQLHRIQTELAINKPIYLLSGYRSPQTNELLRKRNYKVAKHSYHLRGRAMDFTIPGVPLADIRQAAVSLKAGGVGYYPKNGFVHIDTGPVRRWG